MTLKDRTLGDNHSKYTSTRISSNKQKSLEHACVNDIGTKVDNGSNTEKVHGCVCQKAALFSNVQLDRQHGNKMTFLEHGGEKQHNTHKAEVMKDRETGVLSINKRCANIDSL